MDPFSLSTGVVSLVTLALKLVVGALGMIDKTVAAYDEAADELKGLKKEVEQLQVQMIRIHGTLKVLASNTKDPGFKKLLRDEQGQVAVRELCDALEETFNTLKQMTGKMDSDDLRPAPLPSNKKSLEFTHAVLRYSLTPSKLADLVRSLREMRSDVQTCLTKLETTFQHAQNLYDIMNNGLTRIVSRTSIFSSSTNLTIRIKLADWLKRRERTWGLLSRRNMSTPLQEFLEADCQISRMTPDLLGEIFYHLCDKGPLPYGHLLLVSRSFHDAFLNETRLWTFISLDSLFVHYFKQLPEQGDRFIAQCLLRSGFRPLCLSIDLSGLLTDDSSFLLRRLKKFRKRESGVPQRYISLLIRINDSSSDDSSYRVTTMLDVVAALPKSLPFVRHISLSYLGDTMDGSRFPKCPALKRVELFSHATPHPPFWRTNFQQVTTLSFGKPSRWEDYDLETLSQFPRLHDLTLFTEYGKESSHGVISQPPIKFEHIHILRTHGHIPPAILTRFVAPTLQELHLKANAEHFTSIAALNNSFETLCQYIYALLPEAVSTQEPDWAINLSEMVHYSRRIKALYVSKWMEEGCKRFISGLDVVLHVQ